MGLSRGFLSRTRDLWGICGDERLLSGRLTRSDRLLVALNRRSAGRQQAEASAEDPVTSARMAPSSARPLR